MILEAKYLISFTLPTLRPSDTIGKAIELMEYNQVQQLALVDDDIYWGMISQEMLENEFDEAVLLSEIQPTLANIFSTENQHLFEVLNLLQKSNIEVIAVVDSDNNYKGSIHEKDLTTIVSKYFSDEIGGILVLKIQDRDFSLSEIARLVESNDTKILVSIYQQNDDIEIGNTLTIKLNRQNVSLPVATLERFGYEIIGSYACQPIASLEKERFDMLIKYLEI